MLPIMPITIRIMPPTRKLLMPTRAIYTPLPNALIMRPIMATMSSTPNDSSVTLNSSFMYVHAILRMPSGIAIATNAR